MDKKFTSDEVPLAQLLDQASKGELQLPDFQRNWVWSDGAIRSLLASISLSYPIGAVMALRTGNPDLRLLARPLEGITGLGGVKPELLLLDGQQRLTSLYLALRSGVAVNTTDSRDKAIRRWYYVDIAKSTNPAIDREEAIIGVPESRVVVEFGTRRTLLDVTSTELEIEAGLFPLSIVLDGSATQKWMFAYSRGDAERFQGLTRFHEAVIKPFQEYQVPMIQLVKETPKEAVCQVFEKVNTGGVALTVFELLTATYAADGCNLRDRWDAVSKRLGEDPVLDQIEATAFLQTVTLLATLHRGGSDGGSVVSAKRADILRLPVADYLKWEGEALEAYERAVTFLHEEHIFTSRDLPYATQLVPLAAIIAALGGKADNAGVKEKLRRWWWCGILGELYSGATETRFAWDLQEVLAWVNGDDVTPRTVSEAQFQAGRLNLLTTRLSAAYKGLYALELKYGARDFRTGTLIDLHAYKDHAVEIHHVFPKAWCQANQIPDRLCNSIVNKAPIGAQTNRSIGGRAPSAYLPALERAADISAVELDALLRSHAIDPPALRSDDFASFYRQRFERFVQLVEEAMGKRVNRAPEGADNPFNDSGDDPESAVRMLIAGGESARVEFKSTARVNLHTGATDKAMEWSVVKTLAAFANADGGTLLVGVSDDGEAVGLGPDLPTVKGHDLDGWRLWLNQAVSTALGQAFAALVKVESVDIDGETVVRIDVAPAAKPAFAKKDGKEVLMVRSDNATIELTGQALLDYRHSRWPS